MGKTKLGKETKGCGTESNDSEVHNAQNKIYKQCKSCKKTFPEVAILRHISHRTECRKKYSDQEWQVLKDLAKERKKFLQRQAHAKSKASFNDWLEKRSEMLQQQQMEIQKAILAISRCIFGSICTNLVNISSIHLDNQEYQDFP